ncbi:flagellin FliC [Luteimonas sp. MHLX1A]|nr:flagellin FliC [Luteimonas sp. MHLX1A]
MMSVINTNTIALNAQRNLNTNSASLSTTIQRLSSGLRINSAKDDAAGLAISQRMTAQVRGMDQAARNANDGISLAQTAEGAMKSIGENLQRIRELSVQAANGTNSDTDIEALQKEATQLSAEIVRVIDNTKFNGISLFKESNAANADVGSRSITIQVGANANSDDQISFETADLSELYTAASATDGIDISEAGTLADPAATPPVTNVIDDIDGFMQNINESRADLGAIQNRFSSVIANLQTGSENLSASRSRIQDTDYAKETVELTRTQILQQAGTAMLAQAKSAPQSVLSLLQ